MKSLGDYPSILHPLFVAVGEAMDRPQLHPGVLASLPETFSGFTPDQVITIRHVPALASGDKHGHYEISLTGTSGPPEEVNAMRAALFLAARRGAGLMLPG